MADPRDTAHFVGIDRTSLLINDGPSFIGGGTVDVDVAGRGSWSESGIPGSRLEFTKEVARTQTINMSGGADLIIDDPAGFKALVNLEQGWVGAAPPAGILLSDVHGDSFTYHNDMLRIMSGQKTTDLLRLHDVGGERFSLSDTAAGIVVGGSGGPVSGPQPASGIIPHIT
jgi:hypothetical protein